LLEESGDAMPNGRPPQADLWLEDRLSASQRRDLMEIVDDRHGRGSML
jgi:hypothetical protein